MPLKSIIKFLIWLIPLYILLKITTLITNTIDIHTAIWASFVLSITIVVLLYKLIAASDKDTLSELKTPQSPGGFVFPILKLWSVTLFFGIAILFFSIYIYINYSFHDESGKTENYHVLELLSESSNKKSFGVVISNKGNVVKVKGISKELWSKLKIGQSLNITLYQGFFGLNIFKPEVSKQISDNLNITSRSKTQGFHPCSDLRNEAAQAV